MTKEKTNVLITVETDEEKGILDLTVGATVKDKDEVITYLLLALGETLDVAPEDIVNAMLKGKVFNMPDEEAERLLKEFEEEDKKFDGCTGCGECGSSSTLIDVNDAINEIKSRLGVKDTDEDNGEGVDLKVLSAKLDNLLDLAYEKLNKND